MNSSVDIFKKVPIIFFDINPRMAPIVEIMKIQPINTNALIEI